MVEVIYREKVGEHIFRVLWKSPVSPEIGETFTAYYARVLKDPRTVFLSRTKEE